VYKRKGKEAIQTEKKNRGWLSRRRLGIIRISAKQWPPMAAFLKSVQMAIRHNFFIDSYLHQIFTCYKMATWPLIILRILFIFETFRDILEMKDLSGSFLKLHLLPASSTNWPRIHSISYALSGVLNRAQTPVADWQSLSRSNTPASGLLP
jgi:hypothetical protein